MANSKHRKIKKQARHAKTGNRAGSKSTMNANKGKANRNKLNFN
jgi:hypothetical protein